MKVHQLEQIRLDKIHWKGNQDTGTGNGAIPKLHSGTNSKGMIQGEGKELSSAKPHLVRTLSTSFKS